VVIFLLSRVLRVHRTVPITGAEGLAGEIGEVVEPVAESHGKVFVHGEYWTRCRRSRWSPARESGWRASTQAAPASSPKRSSPHNVSA